ncbi:MAG: hypothetical protein IT370_12755 [Deltaproteobacteria bacterium]|nr:hypothetical protein [Deltaproteobacteria bacterium]
MGRDTSFVIVLLSATVAILLVYGVWDHRRQRAALAGLGRLLQGGSDVWSGTAWGQLHGVALHLKLITSTRYRVARTELQATLPAGYGLVVVLQRRGPLDVEAVGGKLLTGDLDFDRSFRVEAAPVDIALRLLDPTLRGALTRLGALRLTSAAAPSAEATRVELVLPGLLREVEAARPALELMASLSARVREAYAVTGAGEAATVGHPYRPMAMTPELAHADERAREVAALARRMARRAALRRIGTAAFLLFVAAATAIILLTDSTGR